MNTRTRTTKKTAGDAIALLTADHRKVQRLFQEFDDIKNDREQIGLKSELIEQICFELTAHTLLEEEIFYPAVRGAISDDALVDLALAEHAEAKNLIKRLEAMEADDSQIGAVVTELSAQIDNHISEEEENMFIKVKQTTLDTGGLGRQMRERKEALEDDFHDAPAPELPRGGAGKETRPH